MEWDPVTFGTFAAVVGLLSIPISVASIISNRSNARLSEKTQLAIEAHRTAMTTAEQAARAAREAERDAWTARLEEQKQVGEWQSVAAQIGVCATESISDFASALRRYLSEDARDAAEPTQRIEAARESLDIADRVREANLAKERATHYPPSPFTDQDIQDIRRSLAAAQQFREEARQTLARANAWPSSGI